MREGYPKSSLGLHHPQHPVPSSPHPQHAIQTQSTGDITVLREVVVKTYRRIQTIHSEQV